MSALAQLLAFLTTTPVNASNASHIRSIHLPTTQLHTEPVSCVYHASRHYITGTDIIRALVFRFKVLNVPIASMKKFEEGVFSDLRNLKVGVGCQLEEPRSPFLVQLHELGCIRTQKKQKVFFWECVNHEYLFQEALAREKKRQTAVTHDGLAMLDGEWRSMNTLWESAVPLKITVNYLSLPHEQLQHAHPQAWSTIDPTVLQSPKLNGSPLKGAPLARGVAAWSLLSNKNRSRSSTNSSHMQSYSQPVTPLMRPSTPASTHSLPVSKYYLLNQANSHGMLTPDAHYLNSMQSPMPVQSEDSLWNDEAIAAVTYEVLKNSPELFNCPSNDNSSVLEYSNWLASVSNTPSDNEMSEQHTPAYSAMSLIDDAGLSMQQLDSVCTSADLASLLDSTVQDANLLSSLQEINLTTELLFASMMQPEVHHKKRARSDTASSTSSTRSGNKRYHPYRLPGSLVM